MKEYEIMNPSGPGDVLRVAVGGRVMLGLREGTAVLLTRREARRFAHDLLKALEPDVTVENLRV